MSKIRNDGRVVLRMQHVLMIGPDPRGLGGIETVLRSYLDLRSEKFEISSLSTWDGTRDTSDRFIFLNGLVRFIWSARSLRKNASFVHVHLSHQGSFIREGAFVILSRLLHIQVFSTVHGSAFVSSAERKWTLRMLYALVLRASNRTAVLNTQSLSMATKMGAASVAILPNPGPIPADRDCSLAGGNGPIVVFAGTVGRRKGADVLLEAWDLVLETLPDARLVILGPVDDQDVVDRAGSLWQGTALPSKVWDALSLCRVAVLPSTAEAMPMFVIEAMGSGRPMVVTDVGAMPSQVEGWGKVVPVGDSRALAVALLTYLNDPVLSSQHGLMALSRYSEFFGAGRVESNLDLFYAGAELISAERC